MYKSFTTLDELFAYIKEDKEWEGAEATIRNRYPIRFILFENFADLNDFIINKPNLIFKFAIEDLVDGNYPDIFPSHTYLSNEIKKYVKQLPANDFVIYPFSEMTRFYEHGEFLSIVKTIRSLQAPEEAQQCHCRFYIPIVGMQGKMSPFIDDLHTFVWEYKSEGKKRQYNLILTNGTTYGIGGLEKKHTVIRTLREWLKLWERGEEVKTDIICTSPNIFANAHHAQPDNAFNYTECKDAFKFLTRGLKIDFGNIEPTSGDSKFWEELASLADAEDFNFTQFVNERFDTFKFEDSTDFIKTWFDCESEFDRWLLAVYYRMVTEDKGYICKALSQCTSLSNSELFSAIATHIFDCQLTDSNIKERAQALKEASKYGIKITENAEHKVYAKLSAMMCGEPEAKYMATKLMTSFTDSDRKIIIESFGKGVLKINDLEKTYPELYHYLRPLGIQLEPSNAWIREYFNEYRISKIRNNADSIHSLLSGKNANQSAFQEWTDNFKTVKTILYNRQDVDMIYWIDGLGVDWIPFITNVIEKHKMENVYLNEIYIARAILPTTTSVNKQKLEEIRPEEGKLKKIGDLDKFAHEHKGNFPEYIMEELKIVEESISTVLSQYNGKKIAFVSDHGLTYLAQYGKGLNLAGIETDHEGRTGVFTKGHAISDNKYVVLDDGKTVCALTDDSLTVKTPKGHGAHGGATPEEVLVPIIIVSNQQNASTYSTLLITETVSGNSPKVKIRINGLKSVDTPMLEYNGVTYSMVCTGNNEFESEALNLVDTANKVSLLIGDYKKTFKITISTGAEEDDLFGDDF